MQQMHKRLLNIKFSDDINRLVEDIGKVSIKRKDDKQSLVVDVLFVLGMKYVLVNYLRRNMWWSWQ